LILSPVHLLIFTSVLLAVGLTVVLIGKRRQENAVGEFSDQLRRLTAASSDLSRIDLEGKPESLERLAAGVNHAARKPRGTRRPICTPRTTVSAPGRDRALCGVVHRQRILFANSRFLALLD